MIKDYISVGANDITPSYYKCRLLFSDISSLQNENETITFIASYQANIYVGTSLGRILHYHHFDDASDYILISQLQISEDKPIKKILILPHIERALVLCGAIVSVFIIPEFSPSHIGKLKSIIDLLHLSYKENRTKQNPINQRIIALTAGKIRIIQISQDLIKLLKDINYENALRCETFHFPTTPNCDSLIVVANEKNYDIIDLKQTGKVPLFEYNAQAENESRVIPQMVPFFSLDKGNDEEFLLTIKSDETTSMSMFINSSGDVTRGTLLWVNEGYPSNGIAIEWPFAFSLCELQSNNNRLVISSLESLEVEFSSGIKDVLTLPDNNKNNLPNKEVDINSKTDDSNFKICQLNESVLLKDDETSSLLNVVRMDGSIIRSLTDVLNQCTTLIYNDFNIWVINEIKAIIPLTKDLKEIFQDLPNNQNELKNKINQLKIKIKHESKDMYSYYLHLLVLALILIENFDQCMEFFFAKVDEHSVQSPKPNLLIDPRFLIYILGENNTEQEISKELHIFYGQKELIDLAKDNNNITKNGVLIDYLHRLYIDELLNADSVDVATFSYTRLKIYDKILLNSEKVVEFCKNHDSGVWKREDKSNDIILEHLENKESYFALLYIYRLIIGRSNLSNKSEYGKKICTLSLALLDKELTDPGVRINQSDITVGGVPFNLIEIILSQLKEDIEDESLYAKSLLRVLKLYPTKGLSLMKSNNKGKYRTIHKRIMEDMSGLLPNEVDFARLRLEYMESNFTETLENDCKNLDLELLDDFLIELTKEIISNKILDDKNKNNFYILRETYNIENTLKDSNWPKITWPDYLNANMNRSECAHFIEMYLKIYELLLVRIMHEDNKTNLITKFMQYVSIENVGTFDYFHLVCEKKNQLVNLLNGSDYSSAEYFALYGSLPLPSKLYYFGNRRDFAGKKLLHNPSKENLLVIFNHYLNHENGHYESILAISHFTSTYGPLFGVNEMLEMLPKYFPVVYLEAYLKGILIDVDSEHRDIALKKVLSKVDAKSTTELYTNIASNSEC